MRAATLHAQICANKARDVLPRELLAGAADGDADRPLTQRETKQLMMPLIRLRQACCHPQARPITGVIGPCCKTALCAHLACKQETDWCSKPSKLTMGRITHAHPGRSVRVASRHWAEGAQC